MRQNSTSASPPGLPEFRRPRHRRMADPARSGGTLTTWASMGRSWRMRIWTFHSSTATVGGEADPRRVRLEPAKRCGGSARAADQRRSELARARPCPGLSTSISATARRRRRRAAARRPSDRNVIFVTGYPDKIRQSDNDAGFVACWMEKPTACSTSSTRRIVSATTGSASVHQSRSRRPESAASRQVPRQR